MFRNKGVLITGGLGFIGSNLARRLVNLGAHVTVVDSLIPEYGGNLRNIFDIQDHIRINISDVRDSIAMSYLLKGQDFLFNLAGQTSHMDSMTEPFADLAINATSQLSILENCRKVNPEIKIVFAGTRQIYGKPDYLPVDENHPIRPVDINGIHKLAGEMYHILYSQVYGLRTCSLRLTNTYGPGMRVMDSRQTFLGIWVRRAIEREPLLVFGDGKQLRDFNFVDDCVDAMICAAESEKSNGRVYNLGSKEIIDLKSLAEMFVSLCPGSNYQVVPFPSDRKMIDIGDYYGNHSLITSDLDWEPKVGLKEGLMRTIDYYRLNQSFYWDGSA